MLLLLLTHAGDSHSVCPDMEHCREVIRNVASRDQRMYDVYSSAFEQRLRALGPAFAARVADYKAQLVKAQQDWKRAPRKQTICRRDAPARDARLASSYS